MRKIRKFGKGIRRRNLNRRHNKEVNNNFVINLFVKFMLSLVIVACVFGMKNDVLHTEKYMDAVKTSMNYSINFQKYSGLLHKKVAEVLNIYDKGEFR